MTLSVYDKFLTLNFFVSTANMDKALTSTHNNTTDIYVGYTKYDTQKSYKTNEHMAVDQKRLYRQDLFSLYFSSYKVIVSFSLSEGTSQRPISTGCLGSAGE